MWWDFAHKVQQPHHFKPFEFCATVHFNGTPHKMVLFSFTKNNVSRLHRTMLVGQLQEIMGQDATGLFIISSLCLLTIFKEIFSSILDFTDLPTISKPSIVHRFLKIHFQQSPQLPSQNFPRSSTILVSLAQDKVESWVWHRYIRQTFSQKIQFTGNYKIALAMHWSTTK